VSARRPRRRRAGSDLPPTPEDWSVAEDDEAHLTRVEGPTALAGELARLARRPGWSERLGAARVAAAWPAIVGEELIAHCEPVRLAGRVLTVRAATPAWATRLRYLTLQLIERSDAVLGPCSVREVNVTVGRLESGTTTGSAAGTADARVRHTDGGPSVRPASDPGPAPDPEEPF
jgi:predicted nucleic acid-binding Zn ribbon protein